MLEHRDVCIISEPHSYRDCPMMGRNVGGFSDFLRDVWADIGWGIVWVGAMVGMAIGMMSI